ncbi:MAG: FecR domain-containing protein [Saprospiraceae bacterium]|nr:FecR domain-containing protein [Saprospiraceae bacterium]
MNTEAYFFLIDKKRREGLTPDEQRQLESWLQASEQNRATAADIGALLDATAPLVPEVNVPAELAAFKKRLHADEAPTLTVVHRNPRRWMWAAAGIFAILVCAVWMLRPDAEPEATWLQVATAVENDRRVDLPDGTVVWLNHHSKLEYRDGFTNFRERRVRLTGEAYFEVQKNTGKSFIVEAPGVTTTVLGTAFNVDAYEGQAYNTVTVREGRVRVEGMGKKAELTAGEKADVSIEMGSMEVSETNTDAVAEWRKPGLTFRDVQLGALVLQLSDRFGRQIRLEDGAMANCRYTAHFPKADLDAVLANLESVFGLKADTSEAGVVRLRGGQCSQQ